MKDLSTLMKLFGTTVNKNSPVILTTMGATGLVATAFFAAQGAVKAYKDVEIERAMRVTNGEEEPYISVQDYIKLSWRHYVPALTVGLSSIACIIGAHNVHSRRQAALMSLYSVVDKSFKEYQTKVKEQIGETKERKVRDEIAQDRVNQTPPSASMVIMDSSDSICLDTFSGRYFKSDMQTLRKAENDINAEIINNCYASLNDYYRGIGLDLLPQGDDFGWRVGNMLETYISTALTPDDKPCYVINYRAEPIRDYYKEM